MMANDYKILRRETVAQLQTAVKEAIAEGWEPQGGVSFSRESQGDFYLQAMVRP